MAHRKFQLGVLLAWIAFSGGCAHVQLRKNTLNQAKTVSDVHLQQVMDNLAMFVYDPNSLPHFSYPQQGAASVSNTGNISFGLGWLASGFNSGTIGGQASRRADESFTMVPINDPHKLALMRCAYQTAVSNCGPNVVSQDCPECEQLFEQFYPDTSHASHDQRCLDEHSRCWFNVGCRKDVPKHCPGQYVGHYCGVYVWLDASGRDELTKLALAILDFALFDPPAAQTRQVVRTVNRDANGNVTGVTEQTTFQEPIKGQYRSRQRAPTPGGYLLLEQNLRALTPPF